MTNKELETRRRIKMITEVLFDVEVPASRGRANTPSFVPDLNNFILSNHRTMCYKFDDKTEVTKMRGSIATYCKRHKLPLKVMARGNDIYIVKP